MAGFILVIPLFDFLGTVELSSSKGQKKVIVTTISSFSFERAPNHIILGTTPQVLEHTQENRHIVSLLLTVESMCSRPKQVIDNPNH